MGWEQRILDDVRRHRDTYRALFGTNVALAAFVGALVLSGAATASATGPDVAVGLALPFVLFPVGYALLLRHLLHASEAGAGPQA